MMLLRALGFGEPNEPPATRARLRAAIAERERALDALVTAQEAVARVENVLEAARSADKRVREAEHAAAGAATKWAAAGANPLDHDEHEGLRTAIAVAESDASRAWFLADGARAGLRSVKEAEGACESALSSANDEIREAIGAILATEIASQVREMELAAHAYEKARLEVMGVYRLLDPSRPGWRDSADHQANQAARLLRGELQRCEIAPLTERVMVNGFHRPGTHTPAALSECTAAYRDYARRLQTDPDAKFGI